MPWLPQGGWNSFSTEPSDVPLAPSSESGHFNGPRENSYDTIFSTFHLNTFWQSVSLASALGGHLQDVIPLRCITDLIVDVSITLTQKKLER